MIGEPRDSYSDRRADIVEAIRRANPVASGNDVPAASYRLDEFIARVVADSAGDPDRGLQGSHWWSRWAAALAASFVIAAAGGVAAAVVFSGRESAHPEAGVACRAAANLQSEIVVIEPGPDPLGRCAAAWVGGRFDTMPAQEAPPLVACVGGSTAVQVFPAEQVDTCGSLGLEPASIELSTESQSIIDLQGGLSNAIDAQCRSQADVVRTAEELIDELGLIGWRVEQNPPERPSDVCARVGVDPTQRLVFIGAGPQP